jgi:hypothetical protein
MTFLNSDQRQLIFDHALGLTSGEQADQAEALIASTKEAADICHGLQAVLSPLAVLELRSCPDHLAERTLARLARAAEESHRRLEQLLANEQRRPISIKVGFWHNLSQTVAIAAAIILVAGVLIPTLGYARYNQWKQLCQQQMSSIFTGLTGYIADHDGQQPGGAIEPGTYWYRVGYQGKDSQSSTRRMWTLVRLGYTDAGDYVCPGRSDGRSLQFDTTQVQDFHDFPAKRYITYSPRIPCVQDKQSVLNCEPILADSNPIFEGISDETSGEFIGQITEQMLRANSVNHRGRGQNVLCGNGSVQFRTERLVGTSNDDMYTLQGMLQGSRIKGCELPSCETDFFFAP